MKRKLLALVMAAAMIFSMAACGSKKDENDKTESVKEEESSEQSEEAEKVEESEESGERASYPANFTASGTDADTYNAALEDLVQFFGEYYSDELDKVAGYDEPVSFTTVNWIDSALQDSYALFESQYGETLEENRWIDAYKQIFNAECEVKWLAQGDDYSQKLRMDMTAGDFPDIFIVREQSDLLELAEAGAIWDLTDVIEEYAVDDLKDIWASDGGDSLTSASVDGRNYGLSLKKGDSALFSFLFIRSDWLEQLGLEAPTTIEELEAIMEAFANADFDGNGEKDTIGIALDKTLYYGCRGLFNAFGAYPEVWVEEDGVLSWGGVSEENKAALACLADWYQKGYISQEFITQDTTQAYESVLAGKCGIVYAGHWFGHTAGDLHELDENSDWVSVALPTGNGEPVYSPIQPSVDGWLVVNSEFEHPELALKMIAVQKAAIESSTGQWWMYENNNSWNACPTRSNSDARDLLNVLHDLKEAYAGNIDPSDLKGKAVSYWANLHGDLQWEWELMFGPDDDDAFNAYEVADSEGRLFYDAYCGPQSDFMKERWTTIKDEQLIAFTKIIIGEVDVDTGFSQWQDTFNSLGGEQITQEVNDWTNSNR